jgi:hypothetical protein
MSINLSVATHLALAATRDSAARQLQDNYKIIIFDEDTFGVGGYTLEHRRRDAISVVCFVGTFSKRFFSTLVGRRASARGWLPGCQYDG